MSKDKKQMTDDGFDLVQTKVPAHIKQLLDILAEQRGMSTYELLQLLINGFITAAKANGPLSPQIFSKAMNEDNVGGASDRHIVERCLQLHRVVRQYRC